MGAVAVWTTLRTGLSSIIGMGSVVERARVGAVAPFVASRAGELMARPPTGVLVHGAPTCGVRTVAHAVAADLASFGVAPAVDLDDGDPNIEPTRPGEGLVVGWSHRPWALRRELRDGGRFELAVFVPPPDWEARRFRVWELTAGWALTPDELDDVVAATEGWTGADLAHLGAVATAGTWADVVRRHRPASLDWLMAAREALVAGTLGDGVDDLRAWLERYRLL